MLTAIVLDLMVLIAFSALKWQSDPLIVHEAIGMMGLVFAFVWGICASIRPKTPLITLTNTLRKNSSDAHSPSLS